MQNIKNISQKLSTIWKKVYIIWGWCVNRLLQKEYFWDIDLTTDATPDEIISVLNVIKEVWKKYWTMIVKEWEEVFEITTFRKDIWILDNRKPVKVEFTIDLNLDSQRRDFTFNSVYYDVQNNTFIDPQNGIADIINSKISFVWNIQERIKEDALRILRFIRFKNKYNLNLVNDNYYEIIRDNINLLKNISIERIKEELEKVFLLERNIEALQDLKKVDFFKTLFPEIDNLENTPWWPKHHLEWDVWIHTLLTIEQLNIIFKNWLKLYDNQWNDILYYYNNKEKTILYWTMLLHDIWKYPTYSIDVNWNVHYYMHEKVWTDMFIEMSKWLKFSNYQHEKILWLIENHLKAFKVMSMKKLKARKQMTHKYFKSLVLVWIVDNLWRTPANNDIVDELKDFYKDFIIKLKGVKFYTWKDILEKYPELTWVQIKNKLNALNDEILFKI